MTLPPPPPDAWGNTPGQSGDDEGYEYRPLGRGHTPADHQPTSIDDLYGERLAEGDKQTAAGLIDGAIVWGIPIYYQATRPRVSWMEKSMFPSKGPWSLLRLIEYYFDFAFSALLSLVAVGLPVAATGATIGMWIVGLRTVRVWFAPAAPEIGGGWYFCNPPPFGKAFKYSFLYPLFDLLLLGWGLTRIGKSNLRQSAASRRAGWVVVERAWLFKLRNPADLGVNAKQVIPEDPLANPRR